MSRAVRSASPWDWRHLRLHVGIASVGLAATAVGIGGVRRSLTVEEQIPWLNLTVAGALVTGIALGAHVIASRRGIEQRRAVVLLHVRSLRPSVNVATDGTAHTTSTRVAAPGQRFFHTTECPLVLGKPDLSTASADAHRARSRRPCGVCRP